MTHYQRTLSIISTILAIGLLFQQGALAVAAGKRPTDEVVAKGNEVLTQVMDEVKENQGKEDAWPWSGQYYAGDGVGFNRRLAIAPEAGVVFWRHGCFGLYDVNYGTFRERRGRIRLQLEEQNKRNTESMRGLHPVLIPIRWGDCRYLIPENEMVDFCNHINSGSPKVSRDALFLRHVDDHEKKVGDIPNVPPKYRPYLLKQPITAEIVEVGKTAVLEENDRWPPGKYRVTEVRLNKGSEDGLLVSMELYHPELPDLRVVEVAKSSCRGEIHEVLWESDSESDLQAVDDSSQMPVPSEDDPFGFRGGRDPVGREQATESDEEPRIVPGIRYSTRSPEATERNGG